MTPIDYRKSTPALRKAWFTFKDAHRGEELSTVSFWAGWNAHAAVSIEKLDVVRTLVAALEKAAIVLENPVADLLTGDQMSETGAYDVLDSIRHAVAQIRRQNDRRFPDPPQTWLP
jgi:hypothetical protein